MTWFYVVLGAAVGAMVVGTGFLVLGYKWGHHDGRTYQRARDAEQQARDRQRARETAKRRAEQSPWVIAPPGKVSGSGAQPQLTSAMEQAFQPLIDAVAQASEPQPLLPGARSVQPGTTLLRDAPAPEMTP